MDDSRSPELCNYSTNALLYAINLARKSSASSIETFIRVAGFEPRVGISQEIAPLAFAFFLFCFTS